MRFSTFTVLSVAASLAAVRALDLPDASVVGTLPAFLQVSELVSKGNKDADLLAQFKALGGQLKDGGADLHKVLGDNDEVESLFSLLGLAKRSSKTELPDADAVGTLPAFLEVSDLLAKGSKDADVAALFKKLGDKLKDQGSDMNKVLGDFPEVTDLFNLLGVEKRSQTLLSDPAVVGTLPAFLEASDLISKGSKDSSVISQFKSLGAKLKDGGSDLHKVLGDNDEVASLFSLLGLDLTKRSSAVESAGQVPTFLSLLSWLEGASDDSADYEDKVKQFLEVGKTIQASGGSLTKLLGTSPLGKAYAEAFATADKGIENGVKEVAKAAQRLAGRDGHHGQMKRRHHNHLEKM